MDGTKRKADDAFSLVDLGTTPPWTLPASLYEESSIRSTQDRANTTNLIQPQDVAKLQTDVGDHTIDAEGQVESGGDHEVYVDTESDGVYMINAGEGSWSAPLASEEDPAEQERLPWQGVKALEHLKRAQELARQQQLVTQQELVEQQESLAAGNVAIEAMLQEKKWEKDLLLRNVIRKIKRQLQEGGEIVLERLHTEITLSCAHPNCPAVEKIIPHGAYYVALTSDNHPKDTYCLFCLEGLWNGEGIMGSLDAAEIVQLDGPPQHQPSKPSPLSQMHFQVPDSLLSSKHAPSPEELSTLLDRGGDTPGSPVSTEDSILSNGDWRFPPTRFQHLSKFVKPGTSLDPIEKAALQLWKMVSNEQLRWGRLREGYKQTVEELNASSEDDEIDVIDATGPSGGTKQSKSCVAHAQHPTTEELKAQKERNEETARKDSVQSDTEHSEKDLESIAGSSKRECRGQNLTAVLANVRFRQTS